MKNRIVALLAVAIVGAATLPCRAVIVPFAGFSFNGQIEFQDNGGATPFRESVVFLATLAGHQGDVFAEFPSPDGVVDAGDGVHIADLTLDEASYVSGVSYDFNPILYPGGFTFHDADSGNHQFTADLTVTALDIVGSGAGVINASFTINLTGITASAFYVPGSSDIIDTFLAYDGAVALTLQFPFIATIIEGGSMTDTTMKEKMLNTMKSQYSSGNTIMLVVTVLALSFLLPNGINSQSGGRSGTVAYDDATYLSQSTPGEMDAGQTYGVSVSMKNTGLSTWRQGNYSLKLINVTEATSKTWSISSVDVNSTVSPGDEIVFNFTIIAPVEGRYNIQWQMANGNAFFGEPSMTVPVKVSGIEIRAEEPNYIENNALFISQKVQSEMEAGQTYDVTVTMKNTGITIWKTGEYKLKVSTKGADNTLNVWTVANVELSDDILPSSEVTFSFKVTAPNKEGVYNFQCQLVKDSRFFGQPSTNVVVNVD